jgi:hypothetical protein
MRLIVIQLACIAAIFVSGASMLFLINLFIPKRGGPDIGASLNFIGTGLFFLAPISLVLGLISGIFVNQKTRD